MCDACDRKLGGWQGWVDVPPPVLSGSEHGWTELSHVITEELSRVAVFPEPRIRLIRSMPDDPYNITHLQMAAHHGTHLDAPRHFIADGPTIDQIPLERLYGRGVVWRFDVRPLATIGVADFERAAPKVEPGDIVYLDTGWARHINTPEYDRHPSLAPEAAEWLVKRGVKLLGVDFGTPDLAYFQRPAGFDFPVHRILLGRGVLIAEHLTNLRQFANSRIDTMFMTLNIHGSDGAPGRMVARPLEG